MKNIIIFILSLIISLWVNIFYISAAAQAELDKYGNIVFVTTDTIATTNVRWTEVGFTIRRDKTSGNPIEDSNYAVLFLKESYRTKKDNGDGTYKVTFTIPKEDVNKALIKGGISGIGEKDIIYLNGIFKVIRYGVDDKSYYRTLEGIKKAASWRNPNDFKELFDVKIPFKTPRYPVYVEYRTSENEVFYTEKVDELTEGEKKTITLDTSKRHNGKTYDLYRSFIVQMKSPSKKINDYKLAIGNTLSEIKKREIKVEIGGTKLVAMMKSIKDSPPEKDEDYIGEELPEEIEAFCIIDGDDRGNEKYEATEGIPTTESLYINGFCEDYVREYGFRRISGVKNYPVVVKRTYILNWTESYTVTNEKTGKSETTYVSRSQNQTVSQTISVKRNYSYWVIEKLLGMVPKQLLVQNGALPGSLVYLEGKDPKVPKVVYQKWGGLDGHIKDPVYSNTLTLSSVSISGGSSSPSVPSEDFTSYAQTHVPEIEVKNDSLIWEGSLIMDGSYVKEKGKTPGKILSSDKMVGKDVFYRNRLYIDALKENENYISSGKVTYQSFINIGAENHKSESYIIDDINDVTVHTPVICNGKIEDKYRDCQMLFPDTSRCSLILGLNFNVLLETEGMHKRITGYGYNDYEKYMYSRQVKFPFDVMKNGVRKKADEWLDTGKEETYYLPTDVKEGKYEVMFRTVAINGKDKLEQKQDYANEDLENYIAVNSVLVEVSGRMYDFQIFDISDYPLWKNVFRKLNSMEKTGFHFSVRDLPIRRGKHPIYSGEGNLKPGYVLRMSLITSGNMEKEGSYIRVLPKFYCVDKNYENPMEVDLYYGETIGGTYYPFVAVGSIVDDKNVKLLKLSDTNLGIDKEAFSYTSGEKEISREELENTWFKTYNYKKIMVPAGAQILFLPKGMQKWYFEYSLPSKIYAVQKDYDIKSYCQNNQLDFKEDFWMKEGYLAVNFDIETIKDGQRHLSYTNLIMEELGYCNMWKKEGFLYQHSFKDGDIGLFELKKSAAMDYQSRGTH